MMEEQMTINPRIQPVPTEFEVLATRRTRSSLDGCYYASLSSNWLGLDGAGCLISMPTAAAGSAAFTISRMEEGSRSG
jgi:hypothetical protein